jgi:hypothetical protein
LVGKPERKRQLGRGVDGRITLKSVLKIQDVRVCTGCFWLREPVASSCEHGNEILDSIKSVSFLQYLSDR